MDDKSTALPSYQDLPPAYTAPQENAATRRASATAAAAAASLPPPPPPPSYKPKRTPSQEEIYIRELKAWAAEKQKMNPGAYGEYFATVTDTPRAPPPDEQQRRAGEGDDRGCGGVEGAAPRHQRRRSDNGVSRRRDSVGEEGGASVPRDGFLKRRMSGLMRMMGRGDGEAVDESAEREDDEAGGAFAGAGSRAELGTIVEPCGTTTH